MDSSFDVNLFYKNVNEVLTPYGFECHPFLIGWYNEQVQNYFHLPYSDNTLAFVVISTPSFFEKGFIPFIKKQYSLMDKKCDLLEQSCSFYFNLVKNKFSDCSVDIIHDFEMTATRRPKVLVQTAGHVSGAVRYYQRKDLKRDSWHKDRRIFGVSIHPEYGGWFALRGIIVFSDINCHLKRKYPKEILEGEDSIRHLLTLFNENWQDWKFRDIIPVKECYSEEQKQYFSTPPKERNNLLLKYLESN